MLVGVDTVGRNVCFNAVQLDDAKESLRAELKKAIGNYKKLKTEEDLP